MDGRYAHQIKGDHAKQLHDGIANTLVSLKHGEAAVMCGGAADLRTSRGINGPKIAFRGPWMSASAAARWASFMALCSGIGKRSDVESPNPCGVDVAVLSMAMLTLHPRIS